MVWTGLGLDWIKGHMRPLIGTGAAIVAIVVAVLGWQYYRSYERDLVARDYNKALVEYQEGRYEAALEAFRNLRAQGEAPYDQLAELYVANSHIALKQPAKAVEALSNAAGTERDGFVGQVMLVTLGLAHEMNDACDQAIRSLDSALERQGPLRQEAMLGKARCNARLGKTQDALDGYMAYLKEFPEGETVEIALRLQQLEAESGTPAKPATP